MTLIETTSKLIGASVPGRGHLRAGRGGQDACCVRRVGDAVVVVVCDGCSAGESSEIGAGVGARFVAADLARRLQAGAVVDDALAAATVDALVVELERLADLWSDGDRDDVVARALLFTLQVAVVTPGAWIAFGVGDGVLRVDGADVFVAAADDGAPDCVAYRVVHGLRDHARLVVHARGTTLSTLTIGTDGAAELAARKDITLPSGELFGGLPLFESDERFVKNPGLAKKRLLALGERGPFDDCTFVVVRRLARGEGGASCA
jgi:hypothetical protein